MMASAPPMTRSSRVSAAGLNAFAITILAIMIGADLLTVPSGQLA